MEKDKIDRIIDAFRSSLYQEFGVNESPTMSSGTGGFSASSPAKGPTAGYDKPLRLDGRNKYVKKYINQLLSNRKKREDRKTKKKISDFNPYFSNGQQN